MNIFCKMDRVIHQLNYLRLEALSDEWVEGTFYSEFLEFGEFPSEYDSILDNVEVRTVFLKVMKAVDEWLNEDSVGSSEEKSWAPLSHEVQHKKLLALLGYFIHCGSNNVMVQEHRNLAILASRLYFKMLSIPGYKAYHIYHSQLFAQSLGCLSYPKTLCENEDNYFNLRQLTREVNSVIKEVALFVYDLRAVIEALQLNPEDMNFEDILSNLVEFTGGAIVNKLDIDKIELVNISRVIYELIDILLCNVDKEPNPDAIQLLFKCLLPKLIAASVDNRSANNLVRASYVTYSGLVLTKYGKSALSGFITLLQHLCYTMDGLERAEVRTARVSLIIGLMSLLPHKSYRYIIRWILKLSATAKVAHRQIALELIAQLLNNEPDESESQPRADQPENPDVAPAETENQNSSEPLKTQETTANNSFEDQIVPENNDTEKQDSNAVPSDGPVNLNASLEEKGATADSSALNTSNAVSDEFAVPGPSSLQNNAVDRRPSNPDSSIASIDGQDPITDSGIQDPTIAFDSECEDYIMSLLNNGEDLAIGELPEPIPELGDIGDLSLFGEISNQPLSEADANPVPVESQETPKPTDAKGSKKKKAKESKTPPENAEASSPPNVPPGAAMSTDDESSQDEIMDNPEQVSEDDIAGLLRQRPHTAPHAALLRAVYERVHDASSTLRARALAVLADCVGSARAPLRAAIAELNGTGPVSRLMVVAARGVSDERAAVRRAAVALVQRELRHSPDADLRILVSLCRDASILVRSAAIAALGELAASRPEPRVLDALLAGPLHQLSDPEAKIQEQVVGLVQQLVVSRLQKLGQRSDNLPWACLAAVARHNMRRHLQKAFQLLAKTTKCVNHRIVDAVSTHLGAVDDARDLQCLVLLTSAARLVEYADLRFLLDYYYSLSEYTQGRDKRLLPLTLELLTLWSRFLKPQDRTQLRDHLASRLATSVDDDGSRIPAATLAAHLDPSNLQWANELLALSEARAQTGGVHEWLRAADLSLVAPAPPSPALLALFLAALADPKPEWTDAEQGACAAGAGRLCVRSRGAAAAVAPALAAILHSPRALQARVNALLALADICVRYTCIVEPLMGSVCACLDNEAPAALRRAAARALTKLMLGGYLRLRSPLYYRYCSLLADSDADVREPAEYYVTCCLTPDTIYHHFVDCVIHYTSGKAEVIPFDSRQFIYDVMLQRLSLVQKLNVQCRLARDVLAKAADMTEEPGDQLTPAMSAALLDSITLLCGPRMKLPRKSQNQGEAADIEDLQERVTANIVSHKMKRTVAEEVVPAVLRLFARLCNEGGQVTAYLVRITNDLLIDYRQEIEELIENDEVLVERLKLFQDTIGSEPLFGNVRNLVTASAPPEPDTPRAPRRRAPRAPGPPRKRALRI